MLYEDQNAHNLKQQYNELENEIADILLGTDSPVRGFAEFDKLISEHDRLLSRQAELKALETKLTKVLPGLEQAEGNLTASQNCLAAEKRKLADYVSDLGKAAFAGLRSGELPDHQIFTGRKELQSRIENLQRQRSELAAGENAGLMEKAKLQTQQLKLKGQLKLEELKIKSVDRALGEAILISKEKLSVRCNQTEEVLKVITNLHKQIEIARDKAKQAEQAVDDSRSNAADFLCSKSVDEASVLRKELKIVRKNSLQVKKEIVLVRTAAVNLAIENSSSFAVGPLHQKLNHLRSLATSIASSGTIPQNILRSLSLGWMSLSRNNKLIIAAMTCCALLFSVLTFLGDRSNGDSESTNQILISPTHNSDKAEGQLGEGFPSTTKEQVQAPNVGRWSKWPQPDEVVAEMASLTMLQSTKPVVHRFIVIQQLSDKYYEIQIETPIQSKGRAVLATVSTEYQSKGQVNLPLIYSGIQSFKLRDGFNSKFRVFRESSGFSNRLVVKREREYFAQMKELQRMLVCSSLHFKVPISNEWKDYHTRVDADRWRSMIENSSQYLSTRAKNYFSIEVTSAYRETKESLEKQYSPLHYAASVRALSLLDQLVQLGGDLKDLGDCGRPPLHIAIETYLNNREFKKNQDFDIAHLKLILDRFHAHGASAEQKDIRERNLLHIVGMKVPGAGVVEIDNIRSTIALFIARGVDIRNGDQAGLSPLHYAVMRSLVRPSTTIPSDYHDLYGKSSRDLKRTVITSKILDCFLAQGANVNAKDKLGNSILHMAAGTGQVDIIKSILDKGGDKSLRNSDEDTPADVLRMSFSNLQPSTNDLAYFRQAAKLLDLNYSESEDSH